MTDLRRVSANLLNQVSDRISQNLGYRYIEVFIPGLGWIDPRPKVTDVTGKYFPDSTLARWLGVLDSLPNKVWEIRIPKVINGVPITEATLRTKDLWKLRTESSLEVSVKPLDIESRDSHFRVTSALIKGKV